MHFVIINKTQYSESCFTLCLALFYSFSAWKIIQNTTLLTFPYIKKRKAILSALGCFPSRTSFFFIKPYPSVEKLPYWGTLRLLSLIVTISHNEAVCAQSIKKRLQVSELRFIFSSWKQFWRSLQLSPRLKEAEKRENWLHGFKFDSTLNCDSVILKLCYPVPFTQPSDFQFSHLQNVYPILLGINEILLVKRHSLVLGKQQLLIGAFDGSINLTVINSKINIPLSK